MTPNMISKNKPCRLSRLPTQEPRHGLSHHPGQGCFCLQIPFRAAKMAGDETHHFSPTLTERFLFMSEKNQKLSDAQKLKSVYRFLNKNTVLVSIALCLLSPVLLTFFYWCI
jgi:hypothetical protein